MGYEITNKNILVTGANRGIGKQIVMEALARNAGKVYAAVRKVESAHALVQELGDRVVPICVDLENPQSIVDAANIANDVDLVINNAGVLRTEGPLSDDAIEALQYELNVNLFGLVRMAKAFAPVLKANGGGAFVQLNSVVSLKAFANIATYSASKAASYSMTQSLRQELLEQKTLVVSVHPGPISTDMANDAGFGEGAESPSLVAVAIFDALKNGQFHVFPDSVAKQIGAAYQSFATSIIEGALTEAVH